MLLWTDPATGGQEAIDFTLALTAVDRAGNESAPSSPIRVRHPGGKPGRPPGRGLVRSSLSRGGPVRNPLAGKRIRGPCARLERC